MIVVSNTGGRSRPLQILRADGTWENIGGMK
ncbi:hypothetical protein GK082_24495 [Escherichia coli]|nr:hypothetical protein [Escherichia coli]